MSSDRNIELAFGVLKTANTTVLTTSGSAQEVALLPTGPGRYRIVCSTGCYINQCAAGTGASSGAATASSVYLPADCPEVISVPGDLTSLSVIWVAAAGKFCATKLVDSVGGSAPESGHP